MTRLHKFVLIALLSAVCLFGQNTPVFPAAVSTNKELLTQSNRASTTLAESLDTSELGIDVANAAAFTVPSGGGLVITIDNERILICSKASNTFTVCAGGRGFDGSSAATHANGAAVSANQIAWHHNQLAAEVKAIETTWSTDLLRYGRSTTGNDTYVVTPSPPLPAYKRGACLVLDADTANTLTASVNVSGLGARSILNRAGSALATGDITANKPITICDDGTQFIIQGDGGGAGGGSVTSVATGCGLTGGTITTTGTVKANNTVNAQIGTTYTYVDGDCGKLVTHSNASAVAGSLPQANGSTFVSGWFVDVQNRGVGTLTVTPTTSMIDGASALALTTGQGVRIFSDGTNYFTQRGSGPASFISYTFSTLTDGATITWPIANSPLANATVTLGGSRTLNITGLLNGGSYVLRIVQDGTGSRGLTLGTGCTWKVANGGGAAISPSTAASTIDILAFTYDGTNCYASLSKNFN